MDALHGEVGTFVQQTTPGQGVVIVRGLKGSEVLHLVDGFRLNNAIFRNAPNQYIALVDGQSLDRIEVVRGPSSTLYGGDAMGGVVQMLTPELRYSGDRWQWNGRLRAIAASADDSLIGRAEFGGGRDGMTFSLGVTSQEVNDLRAGDGRTRPFTGFTQRSGDLRWQFEVAPGHELMLGLQ
jgi:outer membrane cobalamin receptor